MTIKSQKRGKMLNKKTKFKKTSKSKFNKTNKTIKRNQSKSKSKNKKHNNSKFQNSINNMRGGNITMNYLKPNSYYKALNDMQQCYHNGDLTYYYSGNLEEYDKYKINRGKFISSESIQLNDILKNQENRTKFIKKFNIATDTDLDTLNDKYKIAHFSCNLKYDYRINDNPNDIGLKTISTTYGDFDVYLLVSDTDKFKEINNIPQYNCDDCVYQINKYVCNNCKYTTDNFIDVSTTDPAF